SLNVNGQQHFGMNMATDRKFTRAREINLNGLARSLFARVECHTGGVDVDLMEEFVLVREKNAVAATERNLIRRESAALLRNRVSRCRKQRRRSAKHHDNGAATPPPAQKAVPHGGCAGGERR